MRSILPRYPNKSVNFGMNIFPVDKGLTNDGRMQIQNSFANQSAVTLSEPKKEESFWTTPFGAVLSVGLVAGGIYYLGKNMGVVTK